MTHVDTAEYTDPVEVAEVTVGNAPNPCWLDEPCQVGGVAADVGTCWGPCGVKEVGPSNVERGDAVSHVDAGEVGGSRVHWKAWRGNYNNISLSLTVDFFYTLGLERLIVLIYTGIINGEFIQVCLIIFNNIFLFNFQFTQYVHCIC